MADSHHPQAGDLTHGTADNPEIHHEESDVNIRAIFGFGLALIAVAIVVHVAVLLLFNYLDASARPQAQPAYPLALEQQGERLPPEPRLQIEPRQDLAALREREEQTLNSYAVVDRNAGVYRIPIDQAMKLTLERGLPARQGGTR